MKLSRGLSVAAYAIGLVAVNIIGLLFGSDFMSMESIILLSFILAWCNDE